jgi:hypothetical protein
MPRETVTIAVSELYPYESAAMLFAVLAYPKEKADRDRFADAVCNVMLRQFATDPSWADTRPATNPRHLMVAAEIADVRYKHGMKVLNEERFIAAKMAAPKWAGVVQQVTGITHPGLKVVGPTSREMLVEVSSDLDERRGVSTEGYNKANIVSRVWNTSKPVIHLCLSMHRVTHEIAPDQRTFNPWDFFFDREMTRAVITKAAPVFELAEQVFGFDPDEMVEVLAV